MKGSYANHRESLTVEKSEKHMKNLNVEKTDGYRCFIESRKTMFSVSTNPGDILYN